MGNQDTVFLGFCENAHFDESRLTWNVLGMTNAIGTPLLPRSIPTSMFFAIDVRSLKTPRKIRVLDPDRIEIGVITLAVEEIDKPEPGVARSGKDGVNFILSADLGLSSFCGTGLRGY